MAERDFTKKRATPTFTVGSHKYLGRTGLSPRLLLDAQKLMKSLGEDADMLAGLGEIFKLLLQPESFELIRKYINPTDEEAVVDYGDDAIDLEQLQGIVEWLVEQYAQRPTTPSSDSSTGSSTEDSGTPSTAGVSVAE